MTQDALADLIIEVHSSDFSGLLHALQAVARGVAYTTAVLTPQGLENLEYESTSLTLVEALPLLERGEIAAVLGRAATKSRQLFIFPPHFRGGESSNWELTADVEGSRASLFDELQQPAGVILVVLAREDSLDLEPDNMSPDGFPWNDWRLIKAALRRDDGSWLIGHGPAAETM
jgi:hypothetical protein